VHIFFRQLASACEYIEAALQPSFITTSHYLAIINSTYDMGDQSASTRVQTLFEPALQAYEMKGGVTLSEHPLAVQLQDCHTVESITTLLQGQARDFSDSRRNDRITEVIKSVVSILSTFSATSVLGESTGLVRQDALIPHSTSDRFCRYSHPQNRYKLALLSYLLYVIFSSIWVLS